MWQLACDKIGQSFGYLHAKADPDRNIMQSGIPLEEMTPLEIRRVLHFVGQYLRNSACKQRIWSL